MGMQRRGEIEIEKPCRTVTIMTISERAHSIVFYIAGIRNKMAIKIREAKHSIEDAELLHGLVKELAVYENCLAKVTSTASDYMRTGFSHFRVLFAESSGVAVGFLLFYFTYSTRMGKRGLYVEDLFVRESYRGRKIGLTLLSHAGRIAKQNDCYGVDLEVEEDNKSRAWYQQIGFRQQRGVLPYRLIGERFESFVIASSQSMTPAARL